jgi:hypothetical protein
MGRHFYDLSLEVTKHHAQGPTIHTKLQQVQGQVRQAPDLDRRSVKKNRWDGREHCGHLWKTTYCHHSQVGSQPCSHPSPLHSPSTSIFLTCSTHLQNSMKAGAPPRKTVHWPRPRLSWGLSHPALSLWVQWFVCFIGFQQTMSPMRTGMASA